MNIEISIAYEIIGVVSLIKKKRIKKEIHEEFKLTRWCSVIPNTGPETTSLNPDQV